VFTRAGDMVTLTPASGAPPRENRIPAAIEAGVKRHPTARGYAAE
jgi:hypothetical protein